MQINGGVQTQATRLEHQDVGATGVVVSERVGVPP